MSNLKSNTEEPKFKTYSELFDYKNSLKAPSPFISSKYDYGASYETYLTNLDNYRDQQQGFLDTMGNLSARFLLGTGQKVAQGGAFVGGALYGAFNSEIGVMDAAINNGYSKVLSEYTDIIDTEYPIYKGSDYENLSAFELLGDSRWWATQGADMASFVASMALSAKGLDKLGLFRGVGAVTGQVGKITGSLLGNAQKGLKIGQGLGYYGSATITNSAIEGFFEASEVYKNNFKNYQELLGLDEEEAKLKALEDATSSWKWNQAILLPSSLYEMKLLLGGASSLGKGALRYFNSATDEIIKPTIKQYAKNIGTSALEGIVAEGIWEENIQLAVQKHLENITAPTSTFLESSAEVLGNYINNFTTKEGQESILGGAVLGALMGGGGSYLNTKKEFKDAVNRYTKLRESGTFLEATEDAKKIKNLNTNNFTVIESTPETTNELGQIIPSVSTPKINKNKLLQTLNNLSLNLQTDKIAQIVDTMPDSADIKEFLTDSLLSNVVASYSSQGLGSLLLNKFNNVQISEEDRAMFGLYDSQDTTAEQIIQNNKNKVKTLIKKFDKIADIYKAIPNLDINHIFRLSVAKDNLDILVRNIETDLSKSALSFYTQALNEDDPLASKITTNYVGTANDTFRKDVLELLKNKNNSPEKQDYFNKYNKLEFLKKLQNQYIDKLKIFTDPRLAPIAYAAQAAIDQQNQNRNINTIINQSNIETQGGNPSIMPILYTASEDNPIEVTTKDGKKHKIIGEPETNSNNEVIVEIDTGETILVSNIDEIIPKEQTIPITPSTSKKEPPQEAITSTDNTITTQDTEELKEIDESSKKKTTIFTTSISDETGDQDIPLRLKSLSTSYKERLNNQITQLELEDNSNLFVMLFPVWSQDGLSLTEDAEKYLDSYNKELAREFKVKDAIYAVVMTKEGDTYKPVVTASDGNILKTETEDSFYIITSVNKSSNVKNLAEIPLIIQNIGAYTREDLLEMKANDTNKYKGLLITAQQKEINKINRLRNNTINNYYNNVIKYHKIDSFSEGHNNAKNSIDLINPKEGVVEEKADIEKLFIPTSKENKPKNTLVGKLYAIIKKDRRTVRVTQPILGDLEGKVDLIISLLDMYFNDINNIKDDNNNDDLIYSNDPKKPGILNLLIYFKKADMYYLKTNQIYFENGNLYYGNDSINNTSFLVNKDNYKEEKEYLKEFLKTKFLQLSPSLLDSGDRLFYEPIKIENNTLITKEHSNYKSYLLKLNLKAIEPSFNEIARVNKYFIYNENPVSVLTPTSTVAPAAPVVTPAPTAPVSTDANIGYISVGGFLDQDRERVIKNANDVLGADIEKLRNTLEDFFKKNNLSFEEGLAKYDTPEYQKKAENYVKPRTTSEFITNQYGQLIIPESGTESNIYAYISAYKNKNERLEKFKNPQLVKVISTSSVTGKVTKSEPYTQEIPSVSTDAKAEIEYLGTPEISKVEDGDLYQFKTKDGLIGGVMISPTEFRIDGISANKVGKGQGSKMFESLILYLKSKGVTTLSTESAGEGAVKMHNKAVDKGLLTKVKEDGRFAIFTINNAELNAVESKPSASRDVESTAKALETDSDGNFVPKKYTLNRKGENPAPNIPISAIDKESSALEDVEDVAQVKLLEIRGKNSQGQTVGTVWIQKNDGQSYSAEVFFNDAELKAVESLLSKEQSSTQKTPVSTDTKADIERRIQEELNRQTPIKNEKITVDTGIGEPIVFQVITYKDGSVGISANNEKSKRYEKLSNEAFQDYLKFNFELGAKGIIKTELVKDDYTDQQSQEIRASIEKSIRDKYAAPDAKADIERRRQEDFENLFTYEQRLGNYKRQDGVNIILVTKNGIGEWTAGTKIPKTDEKGNILQDAVGQLVEYRYEDKFERFGKGENGKLKAIGHALDLVDSKINAKYDAEYIDAVKKGTMTREQAMQALEEAGRKDSETYAELAALGTDTKADMPIGKVGNTDYEVKADGVYYKGNKLDNPENKSHRQLIEADIERRRQEELNKWKNRLVEELTKINNDRNKEITITQDNRVWKTPKYTEESFQQEIEATKVNNEYAQKQINAKYDAELDALSKPTAEEGQKGQAETKPKEEREVSPIVDNQGKYVPNSIFIYFAKIFYGQRGGSNEFTKSELNGLSKESKEYLIRIYHQLKNLEDTYEVYDAEKKLKDDVASGKSAYDTTKSKTFNGKDLFFNKTIVDTDEQRIQFARMFLSNDPSGRDNGITNGISGKTKVKKFEYPSQEVLKNLDEVFNGESFKYDAELTALKGKPAASVISEPVVTPIEPIIIVDTITTTIDTTIQDDDIDLDKFIKEERINFDNLEENYPNLLQNETYLKVKKKINKNNYALDLQKEMLKKSFC